MRDKKYCEIPGSLCKYVRIVQISSTGKFEYLICRGLYAAWKWPRVRRNVYEIESWKLICVESIPKTRSPILVTKFYTHKKNPPRDGSYRNVYSASLSSAWVMLPKDVCSTCRTGTDMASRGLESEAKGMTTDKVWNNITRPAFFSF